MGSLETRIMFLIVFLGVTWLMLSSTGRSYINNFAAVITGVPVSPVAGTPTSIKQTPAGTGSPTREVRISGAEA